jgi:hypothetical protein
MGMLIEDIACHIRSCELVERVQAVVGIELEARGMELEVVGMVEEQEQEVVQIVVVVALDTVMWKHQ